MWDLVLVVRTTDTRDDGPRHFLTHMTQEEAEYLLTLRAAFNAAGMAAGTEPYCVEFMRGHGYWGSVAGYEADRAGAWAVAHPETRINLPESVELESIKVTGTGLVFSAAWKNDDSGVYFETPELSWDAVKAWAKARNQAPAGVLPDAVIDRTENVLSRGFWMEENGDIHEENEEDDDGDEPAENEADVDG